MIMGHVEVATPTHDDNVNNPQECVGENLSPKAVDIVDGLPRMEKQASTSKGAALTNDNIMQTERGQSERKKYSMVK